MKKIILLLTAMCFIVANGICSTDEGDNGSGNQPTREEINIEKTLDPPIPRPRSIIKPIEAYLNHTDSVIEVYFNFMFGNVTVTVEDAEGNVVSSMACDTDIEEAICIDAPATEGKYVIKIVGEELSAEGSFTI